MKNNLFYYCPICGRIVMGIEGDNPIMCCGKMMDLLVANNRDASLEKHVPVYEVTNDNILVTVGEIEHPMLEEHYIGWVALVGKTEVMIKRLSPGDKAIVKFPLINEGTIYAYCNIHGLWKKELK